MHNLGESKKLEAKLDGAAVRFFEKGRTAERTGGPPSASTTLAGAASSIG